MDYDRNAPKQRIDMTLNEDLVRRARVLTGDLSETVEGLVATFLLEAGARDDERQRLIDAHVAASDAFIARHGSLADEFGSP